MQRLTIDIDRDTRDELHGLYSVGILELGYSEGDHFHSLYTHAFKLAIEEVLINLLMFDLPTARFTQFDNVWRSIGSFESLSDFFGMASPNAREICIILENFRRRNAALLERIYVVDSVVVNRSLNSVTVEVGVWK